MVTYSRYNTFFLSRCSYTSKKFIKRKYNLLIVFFFLSKVSIFLRENLQTQQGQFVMKTNGIVPTGFQPPGEIRFVNLNKIFFFKFLYQINLEHINEVV
jgi:hypothetical protein